MRLFGSALLLFMTAISQASAADKQELLYDVVFDMDQNKVWDRAVLVLVGPGRKDFGELTKERYILEEGERVDLFIYLNGGDGPVDVTKPPTVRKEGLLRSDELSFVMPLAVNAKGSLRVMSSNGFGNTFNTTETLTIVYRDGGVIVGGFALDFYNSRDEQSQHCSINYLTGKAVKRENGGKNMVVRGRFEALALDAWQRDTAYAVCEDKE